MVVPMTRHHHGTPLSLCPTKALEFFFHDIINMPGQDGAHFTLGHVVFFRGIIGPKDEYKVGKSLGTLGSRA